MLEVGDIVKLKQGDGFGHRTFIKFSYNKKYEVLEMVDNPSYADGSGHITKVRQIGIFGSAFNCKIAEQYFEKVKEEVRMFKPGDKLKRNANWEGLKLENYPSLSACDVYTVTKYNTDVVYPTVSFEETGTADWDASYFELVDPISKIKSISEGFEVFSRQEPIAKPILEERKVGKIEMDLFDSGFPNAILEVAKVMTWAGQNKGYKPHDWTNLPNAEVEFSAAASRHKMKSLIQKVDGVVAQDRVDEESGIVHLAHEAFNVLAHLELVLRGKIK